MVFELPKTHTDPKLAHNQSSADWSRAYYSIDFFHTRN